MKNVNKSLVDKMDAAIRQSATADRRRLRAWLRAEWTRLAGEFPIVSSADVRFYGLLKKAGPGTDTEKALIDLLHRTSSGVAPWKK